MGQDWRLTSREGIQYVRRNIREKTEGSDIHQLSSTCVRRKGRQGLPAYLYIMFEVSHIPRSRYSKIGTVHFGLYCCRANHDHGYHSCPSEYQGQEKPDSGRWVSKEDQIE